MGEFPLIPTCLIASGYLAPSSGCRAREVRLQERLLNVLCFRVVFSTYEYLDVHPFHLFPLGFFDRLVESELDILRLSSLSTFSPVACSGWWVTETVVVLLKVYDAAIFVRMSRSSKETLKQFRKLVRVAPFLSKSSRDSPQHLVVTGELLHHRIGDFLRLDRHLLYEMGVAWV